MKRLTLIGVALFSALALGAMAAPAAQAETAPYFTISGTRLVAGKTHNFDAKQKSANFVWSIPALGFKFECTAFSTQKGVLLGSNAGEPGKDNEIAVFTGCRLIEGNGAPECELASTARGEATTTITPGPLRSEQVESVASGTKGNQLLEEFFPASGDIWATLFFRGADCTIFEAPVEGAVAGENLLDNANECGIELGQAPQQRGSWLLKFPERAIDEVWLISNGVGKITKTQLSFAGEAFALAGTVLVLLTSTKSVPEPNTLWSPLP